MPDPANRPDWERHPLWLDRERLEAISDRMWLDVQKTMMPGKPRPPRRSPGRTELTVVGGTSVEDVFSEAVQALRKTTKHRTLPDGSEIAITSLDVETEEGRRQVDEPPDPGGLTEDEAVEQVLRSDRLLAFRQAAEEVLPQRDRDIVFRVTRGETNTAIAQDAGVTPQRVGQIYAESLRKINGRLRSSPKFRRLYEPEGGNPDG